MGKIVKWIGIVVVAFIVLGVIGSMLGGNKSTDGKISTTSASNTSNSTPELASSYKVGDVVKTGDYVFTTISVNGDAPSGNEYTKPTAGNRFVTVELSIENKGTTKTTISTVLNMYLKSGDGSKFQQSFLVNNKPIDGELLANDIIKGSVTYEVPKTASGLKFYYNPAWITGKSIVIDLGI